MKADKRSLNLKDKQWVIISIAECNYEVASKAWAAMIT